MRSSEQVYNMVDIQHGLKRRTIRQVIEKKLGDWYKTMPQELVNDIKDHIIVTGGCIASMLLGESIKDFDLYCDSDFVAEKLANYYVAKFIAHRQVSGNPCTKIPFVKRNEYDDRVVIYVKSAGIIGESTEEDEYRYFEGNGADSLGAEEYVQKAIDGIDYSKRGKYHPTFLSENAITLSDKIQIVIRFTGIPDEIHKNYDFVHATNYYYTGDKKLILRTEALESLLSRALIYRGSLYPVCSLFRIRKFMERGWRISAGEITKIAFQISKLDLDNPKILREQLIGVDAAYFHELINLIGEWKDQNEGKPLDTAYVIALIDQMADQDMLGV